MNKIDYYEGNVKIMKPWFVNNSFKRVYYIGRFGICVSLSSCVLDLIYHKTSGVDEKSFMIDYDKIKLFKVL
jgi:hypothetical protein